MKNNARIYPLALLFLLVVIFVAVPMTAQQADPKALKIVESAIAAMGGASYLNVQNSVGRGQFTPFQDGVQANPASFIDIIVYPDTERTEFRSAVGRTIQVNVGGKGWIYDGASRSVKDATQASIDEFKLSLKTGIESLLRGTWRKDSAKLTYVGQRSAGLAKHNDVVRLTYPDGFTVEYEFGAIDHLPAKILYQKTNGAAASTPIEDRFALFQNLNDIQTPLIIDHYIDGKQASRTNYATMDYNTNIDQSLFEKPTNLKKVK